MSPRPLSSPPITVTPAPDHGMRLVWRMAAATTLIVGAFSMTNPVLAVLLQQRGHGTAAIGAFAMIPFLMVALLIPFMPALLARMGLVRAYRAGCLLELLGCLGFALGDSLAVWLPASVVSGAGAAALWNATEALLARHAPADRRGRVMGLYQTFLGGALAVGPFAPALLAPLGLGARGVLWCGACVVLLTCLVAASARIEPGAPAAGDGARAHGVWPALRQVPALGLIAFAGGVFEAGLGSVSAAHAAGQGMSLAGAASVVGAIGMGSFLAQYPAGVLADRWPPRRVFGSTAVLLFAASLGAGLSGHWPWLLWLAGGVWGGVGGALYTLTMIRVAHRFSAASVASGTAAMIIGYTAGGTVGPVLSGLALQALGMPGLALWLALLSVAVGLAARHPGA